MENKKEMERINIIIPTELKHWAWLQAQMEYTSFSGLIRKALLLYLQRHGDKSIDILDYPTYEPPKNTKR